MGKGIPHIRNELHMKRKDDGRYRELFGAMARKALQCKRPESCAAQGTWPPSFSESLPDNDDDIDHNSSGSVELDTRVGTCMNAAMGSWRPWMYRLTTSLSAVARLGPNWNGAFSSLALYLHILSPSRLVHSPSSSIPHSSRPPFIDSEYECIG